MNILSAYAINGVGSVSNTQQSTNFNKESKDIFQKGNITSPIGKPSIPRISNLYSPWMLLNAYLNKDFLNSIVEKSPELKNLADTHGFEIDIKPENVRKISNSHLKTTTKYAMQIAEKMNLDLVDKKYLEQACVFHDIGKVLIPDKILNKPDKLNSSEKEVMDLHAEMGYELMKNTGMNNRVLKMIKNHHMPSRKNSDILGQILSVADIYSALREQRCYKSPMSVNEAMTILDQKAREGEVSTEVVNALKASQQLHI